MSWYPQGRCGRCMCGAPDCPSCGSAQGTYLGWCPRCRKRYRCAGSYISDIDETWCDECTEQGLSDGTIRETDKGVWTAEYLIDEDR